MVRAPLSCASQEPLIIFYDPLTPKGGWRERNRVGVSCPPALETSRRVIQAGSRHNVLDGIWRRSWKVAIQSAQFVGVCRLLDEWLIGGLLCPYFDNSLKSQNNPGVSCSVYSYYSVHSNRPRSIVCL